MPSYLFTVSHITFGMFKGILVSTVSMLFTLMIMPVGFFISNQMETNIKKMGSKILVRKEKKKIFSP